MATSMASNLKLLCVTTSNIIDATIYRKMIGSLMYLMNMRSDTCFVVKNLSQYIVDPRCVHLIDSKHVLRYLKGMIDYDLIYVRGYRIIIQGYVDSNWDGSVMDRKSTS